MRPFTQISKKIYYVFKYITLYICISFMIVRFFSIIYFMYNVDNYFSYSLNTFLGISKEFSENVYFFSVGEVFVSHLFNTVIVTSVLIKFLKPINPISMSKYIVYNTKKKCFSFRYWIMLPEGKYLFDAKLRVIVTTPEAHQVGINTLPSKWESRDKDVLNLGQIRGIRFLELNERESQELLDFLNNQKFSIDGNRSEKNRCEINFVISAYDEVGARYYRWQRYQITDILYGFQFVPLQGHEYCDERFFSEEKSDEDFVTYIETPSVRKELFRYQHFDKVYPLSKAAVPSERRIKRDILIKEQIINGQYKGLRQMGLDMCSWILMFFLDRSHWKDR